VANVAQAGGFAVLSCEGARESGVVGAAFVVDVVGLENGARKLLQQVILFVGGPVGADDANGRATAYCRESP
jgi:hypothetical protein